MVLEKIPSFSEVKNWSNNNLVTSVNGNVGDVEIIKGDFGTGKDGAVTNSNNQLIQATTYNVDTTITVDRLLWVRATESITIDGTIDAKGVCNNGGARSTSDDNSGESGGSGILTPYVSGGSGGSGTSKTRSGGNGGNGDTSSPYTRVDRFKFGSNNPIFNNLNDIASGSVGVAPGGGGGSAGLDPDGGTAEYAGNDGSFPGGGGSGNVKDGNSIGPTAGGDGGDGGGLVILQAPEINLNGSIIADGTDGKTGNQGTYGDSGGGGGGGSGGLVIIESKTSVSTTNISVTGGSGGTGQSDAGDGANGASGEIVYRQV